MKRTILTFLLLLNFCSFNKISAQGCSDYTCLINKAKKAISDKNYQVAFDNLEAADGHPNKNITEMKTLREQLFNAINKEKNEAIKQTLIAQEKTKLSEKNELKATNNEKQSIARSLIIQARDMINAPDKDEIIALRLAEAAMKATDTPTTESIKCVHDICSNTNFFPPFKYIRLSKRTTHQTEKLKVVFADKGDIFASCENPPNLITVAGSIVRTSPIRIWKTETGKNFKTINSNTGYLNLCFSQNSEFLLVQYADSTIKMWDVNKDSPILLYKDSTKSFGYKDIFFKDNKPFLFVKTDSTLLLIDIKNNNIRSHRLGTQYFRYQISDDGKTIIFLHSPTSNDTSAIRLVDVENNNITILDGFGHITTSATFTISTNKKLIAFNRGNIIEVWSLESRKKVKELTNGHKTPINFLTFSNDSKYLLSSEYPQVGNRLWDLELSQNIQSFEMTNNESISILMTLNNRYVLQYGYNGIVYVWRTYFDLIDPEKNATLNDEQMDFFGVPRKK